MKIYAITGISPFFIPRQNNKRTPDNVSDGKAAQFTPVTKPFAYRDYNLSFTGRTPENFYAQTFNRENMPESMKSYLNYDYETRQHIPPEQMVGEVFKYLTIADNFSDVKSIYPDENLFANLHENKAKNRTSILAEIRMAKELDDAPLLKTGSDNFGMYLLRKIYVEGKTLKEINKDFYEKDLNDNYKGIITKPLTQEDTASYGIKFPKKAFWHSFIATREEYRKFFQTLPKNSVNPAAHVKNPEVLENKVPKGDIPPDKKTYVPRPRKYKINVHDKRHLTDEIKTTTPTVENVARKVRRRFGSSDPEASFIVKYLSPIMAVAADRVHLSEEMKLFCENERMYGKTSDDEVMFKRFWKKNPEILDYYAQTITDTMDLFEEVYAEGGLIPVNNDLEVVTPDTKNQNIIDYINPEYLDLLNYTQTILPERESRYMHHDELQKQWEEHFIKRYGDVEEDVPAATSTISDDETNDLEEEFAGVKALHPKFSEDLLKETAAKFNSGVYKLKNKSGNDIYITADLDEVFGDYLKIDTKNMPSAYAKLYTKEMKSNPAINNPKMKLTIAAKDFMHELDDDQIYPADEFGKIMSDAMCKIRDKYRNEGQRALYAMTDTLAEICPDLPAQAFFHAYWNYTPATVDSEYTSYIAQNKSLVNAKYALYSKPFSNIEKEKLANKIMQQLANYEVQPELIDNPDTQTALLMLKDAMKTSPRRKEDIKALIKSCLSEKTGFFRGISNIDKLTKTQQNAKFEQLMNSIIPVFIYGVQGVTDPMLLPMIDEEIFMRYVNSFTPETRYRLMNAVNMLNPEARRLFKNQDVQYYG